jgi:hypothetical protein
MQTIETKLMKFYTETMDVLGIRPGSFMLLSGIILVYIVSVS